MVFYIQDCSFIDFFGKKFAQNNFEFQIFLEIAGLKPLATSWKTVFFSDAITVLAFVSWYPE